MIGRSTFGLAALLSATALPAAPPSAAEADRALDGPLAAAVRTDGPGCVTGIASGGKLLASRAAGFANLDLRVPMRTEMAFDIASASKQFTGLSIAMLARRGKLDLDADIRTYLPDMPVFETPIRVRDLLQHSSGLPDTYEPLSWLVRDPDQSRYPSDLPIRMARGITRLKFKPGSQYEYSNLGYLLLAEIVEKVSGQTIRAFADANIFRPLGMTSTHFHDNAREIVPNRASAYSLKADGRTWEWRHSDTELMGDGGVISTLADMAKWLDFYADPSKLPDGVALRDMIMTPARYAEKGASYMDMPIDYGFAIQMFDWKGQRVIGHPGGFAGYTSLPYYFPARNFAVIALCNAGRRAAVRTAVLETGAALASAR